MTKYEMMKVVARIMDDFIIDSGNNPDPRANSNQMRKMLYTFYRALTSIHTDAMYGDMQLRRVIGRIIENKLTSHNFDGSPGFEQVDEEIANCRSNYAVYDAWGNEVQQE